jgi:hypothetical protein
MGGCPSSEVGRAVVSRYGRNPLEGTKINLAGYHLLCPGMNFA